MPHTPKPEAIEDHAAQAVDPATPLFAFGGGGLAMLKRIIKIIDYSLNDQETDELTLEVSMKGASMQEDERTDLDDDENPGGLFNEQYLGDDVTMDEASFSTTTERCGWDAETITRSDLEALRDALDSVVRANAKLTDRRFSGGSVQRFVGPSRPPRQNAESATEEAPRDESRNAP